MNKILQRTLDMVKYDLTDTSTGMGSYVSSLKRVRNESKAVFSQIQDDSSKTADSVNDTFKRIKSGQVFKNLYSWFMNEATNAEDEFSDDDEDLYGFSDGDSSDDEKPSLSIPSSVETGKQISAAFKIGAKQAEVSIANTAELVTTINQRSAEMLTAINTINKTAESIDKKLEKLVKLQTAVAESNQHEKEDYRHDGITDANSGLISLPRLYDEIKNKNTLRNSDIVNTIEFFRNTFGGGMHSPEEAFSTIMNDLRDKISVKGRSINQWGKSFNKFTEAFTENLFSSIIDNEKIKKVIGNVRESGYANTDYGRYKVNQYNEKPALFDGMVRKSIITVIPEYLKSIDAALNKRTLNIDDYGNLTTKNIQHNEFRNLTAASFQGATVDSSGFKHIQSSMQQSNINISNGDLRMALAALKSGYVQVLYSSAVKSISGKDLNETSEIGHKAKLFALQLLAYANTPKDSSWELVLSRAMFALAHDLVDGHSFTKEVNKALVNMDCSAMTMAQNTKYGNQARAFTSADFQETFVEMYDLNAAPPSEESNAPRNGVIQKLGNKIGNAIESKVGDSKLIQMSAEELESLIQQKVNAAMSNTGEMVDQAMSNGGLVDQAKGVLGSTLASFATGDVIDNAKNFVNKATDIPGLVGGVMHKGANAFRDSIVNEMAARNDRKELDATSDDISDSANISEADKILAQEVLQMMNAAMADGDPTPDIQAIKNEIAKIKDANVRKRLTNSVIPMLNRMTAREESGESKKGISGMLLKAFGLITKPIRTFLSMAWTAIKSFGMKFLNAVKNLFTSGLRDVGSGFKNIGQSLFGTKAVYDEDGNLVSEARDGFLSSSIRGVKKIGGAIWDTTKGVASAAVDTAKNLASYGMTKLGDVAGNIRDAALEARSNKELVNGLTGSDKEGADAVAKTLGEKFRSTQFGAGFMSAFDKQAEEKLKAKISKAETMADAKADNIDQMISGVKESIFTKMIEILDKIAKHTNPSAEDEENEEEGGSDDNATSGDTSTSTTTTTTTTTSETTTETDLGSSDNDGGGTSGNMETPDLGNLFGGDSSSTDTSSSSSSGNKSGLSALFNIGKLLGGVTKILMGLGKMMLSIIMGMSGIKAITQLVEKVLTKSLAPLNRAFKQLYAALKPIIEQLGGVIKVVAESVTRILEALIDTLIPLLDSLMPIIDVIVDLLEPMLDMITTLIEVLLKPITIAIKTVIVPIMKVISNVLQYISGVLQVGFGLVMTGLGWIIQGLGAVAKALTGKTGLLEAGKKISSQGTETIKSGMTNVSTAVTNMINDAKALFSGEEEEEEVKEKATITLGGDKKEEHGSILDGTISSDSTTSFTYGSGDQQSYGSYLNMSKRGCGPIALAEAMNRRTGNNYDATSLASAMHSTGAYSTNRGTSVDGFINTANSMGVPMRAGGVTSASLKQASQKNPITVVGSGSAFGTRAGNDHFVNVIGTNGQYATVSNPLTGTTSRQPISSLVSNSKLGIYGSGDVIDGYHFPDAVSTAIEKLVTLTSNFFSIFTGESTVAQDIERAELDNKEEEARRALGVTIDEDGNEIDNYAAFEDDAYELFKQYNPQGKNESDAKYQERWERNKQKYMVQAASEAVKEAQSNSIGAGAAALEKYNNTLIFGYEDEDGTFQPGMSELIAEAANSYEQTLGKDASSSSSSRGSGFYADNGAKLGINYTPEYKEVDMSASSDGYRYMQSPIHEFFGKMGGEDYSWSEAGINFWNQRGGHDKTGEGHSGESHRGVDIHTEHDDTGKIPVYATTDGTVNVIYDASSSAGNCVGWKDVGGVQHRVLHMNEYPSLKVGDKVEGGKTLLGHIGKSGVGNSAWHIHYDVGLGEYNPMTYFKWKEGSVSGNQGKIDLTGLENYGAGTSYYEDPHAKPFVETCFDQGMSPAQAAVTFSTCIWEDGAKKIFGTKAINGVTYDYAGQAAKGLFNWAETGESYGDTIPEQLAYIYKSYYADPPGRNERGHAMTPNRSYPLNSGAGTSVSSWAPYWKNVMGYDLPEDVVGKPLGPLIDEDILLGGAYMTGTAIIPEAPNIMRYPITAAQCYNWMIDEGIVTPGGTSSTDFVGPVKPASTATSINAAMTDVAGPSFHDASKWKTGDYVKFKMGAVYNLGNSISNEDFEVPDEWRAISWEITGIRADGIITMTSVNNKNSKTLNNVYPEELVRATINGCWNSADAKNKSDALKKSTSTIPTITQDAYSTNVIVGSGNYDPYSELSMVYGSGDYGYDDFTTSNYIPPVDVSKLNTSPVNNFQTYNVYESMSREEMIYKLSSIEFNVSAKKLESMVQTIINKMDDMETRKSQSSNTTSKPKKMFNDEIPKQVSRLYS